MSETETRDPSNRQVRARIDPIVRRALQLLTLGIALIFASLVIAPPADRLQP